VTRRALVRHEFVDTIPDQLQDGVVYVSITYATVLHLCCCGCRSEVVTPLSPTSWSVTFDGQSISLQPSIGNWNFPCRSHYWIERNHVRWEAGLSQDDILGRSGGDDHMGRPDTGPDVAGQDAARIDSSDEVSAELDRSAAICCMLAPSDFRSSKLRWKAVSG